MPYRHAYIALLALLGLSFVSFWPQYLAVLPTASVALHVHGITAGLWLLLLAFQSWSIQSRQNVLHRSAGLGLLVLYPLFAAGGVLVIQSMAQKHASGHVFYAVYGPGLGVVDAVATLAIGAFVYLALRHRKKVHLHSGYLLGTAFFLVSPVLARILPILPPLAVTGPSDMHHFAWGVHISNGLAAAGALLLHLRYRRFGRPMLATAVAVALTSVGFETVAKTDAWRAFFVALGEAHTLALFASGVIAGALVVWFGWGGGRTAVKAAVPA